MSKDGGPYRRCGPCTAKTFGSCWKDGAECPYCGAVNCFKFSGHGHGGFNRAQTIIILQVRKTFRLGSFKEAHSLLRTKRLNRIPKGKRCRIMAVIRKDMTLKNLTLSKR